MKVFAVWMLGFVAVIASAAPVPNAPPVPSIEGKYTLLTTVTGGGPGGGGRAKGANPFGAEPAGGGFSSSPAALRRETIISKDTIQTESVTATWEYKLNPITKPMGIDITVTPVRGKKSKLVGIVEMNGDRLTMAYVSEGTERPKDFEDAEGVVIRVYQKAPPPPRAEYRIVVMKVGEEGEAEKMLNALAKDGFEVALTTAPTSTPGVAPSYHLILKRMVK